MWRRWLYKCYLFLAKLLYPNLYKSRLSALKMEAAKSMQQVILHTYPSMNLEQSVPKRRHIKFRRREITKKKTYNIQNTAKV
jgi:hypothetical protein